jgi:hypothetical protein
MGNFSPILSPFVDKNDDISDKKGDILSHHNRFDGRLWEGRGGRKPGELCLPAFPNLSFSFILRAFLPGKKFSGENVSEMDWQQGLIR